MYSPLLDVVAVEIPTHGAGRGGAGVAAGPGINGGGNCTPAQEPGHGRSCACARRRRGARPQPDSGVAERGWRDQRGRVRPARQWRPARTTSTEEPGHGGLCASAHHRRGAEPQQESGVGERGLHGSSVLRGHSV